MRVRDAVNTRPRRNARRAIPARDLGCEGRYCLSYVSRA